MKNCPKCGQARQGENYKCPDCDVFYSRLDEILFDEEQKREQHTFKGAVKRVKAADNSQQAVKEELRNAWRQTPLRTKVVLWTIFAFVFVLVVPVF